MGIILSLSTLSVLRLEVMIKGNSGNSLEAARTRYLERVDQLTAEYRRKVSAIAKSLEDRKLSRLQDELKNI